MILILGNLDTQFVPGRWSDEKKASGYRGYRRRGGPFRRHWGRAGVRERRRRAATRNGLRPCHGGRARTRREGEVIETETGDDGAAYGVEVRKDDGSVVEVNLDESFEVIGTEADDDGSDDPGADD